MFEVPAEMAEFHTTEELAFELSAGAGSPGSPGGAGSRRGTRARHGTQLAPSAEMAAVPAEPVVEPIERLLRSAARPNVRGTERRRAGQWSSAHGLRSGGSTIVAVGARWRRLATKVADGPNLMSGFRLDDRPGHSLAGNSATVGFRAHPGSKRLFEAALQHLRCKAAVRRARSVVLVVAAVQRLLPVRRGFLPEPPRKHCRRCVRSLASRLPVQPARPAGDLHVPRGRHGRRGARRLKTRST
jgi:hypothetical protein